jgi:hypothetical protein
MDPGYMVQSVLFGRKKWDPRGAIKWLKTHGYAAPKIDTTLNYYRFRQVNPDRFAPDSFRTLVIDRDNMIEFVVGSLKLEQTKKT